MSDDASELLAKFRRDARRREAELVAARQGWTVDEAEAALEATSARSSSTSSPPATSPASSSAPTRVAAGSQVPARSIRGDEALARSTPVRSEGPPIEAARRRARKKRGPRARARRRDYVASLEARGARGCRPRDFKRATYDRQRDAFDVESGAGARRQLAKLPHTWRPALEHLARNRPGIAGELPSSLGHVWSRAIVACAVIVWSERRKAGRAGTQKVMDGFTQGMICGLFRNKARAGEAYSRSRVFGSSYRADSDECGWFEALYDAGILYWSAPPLDGTADVNPRFIGPPHAYGPLRADGTRATRRYAFAVYWLRGVPRPPS